MRMSALHVPTLREPPADAEAVSHRLMVQAGLIRQSASGTYTWLHAGLRALQKVAAVVREEMDRAGAQEILMPIIQPAELWRESGRWLDYGAELFRLRDRHAREFALGPTHEEIITDLVRGEVRSYRQLPLTLYQINLKFRDEIRPRFGVMRSREFMMKDAYSFDADEDGLTRSYQRMYAAYGRIFARLGLDARPALADSGAIGGTGTHEFIVASDAGEVTTVSCAACGYFANLEQAEVAASARGVSAATAEVATPACGGAGAASVVAACGGAGAASAVNAVDAVDETGAASAAAAPVLVHTPGMHTVEEVAGFLGVGPAAIIKTLLVTTPDGTPAAALVRGDHDLSAAKMARALGVAGIELADAATVERVTGAVVGFAGPVGLRGVRIVADWAVAAMGQAVTGANRDDSHLVGVRPGRDFECDLVADLRNVQPGDPCPACGRPLALGRGIEVGQVFRLGTKYSAAFGASFTDETGAIRPMIMGCYGIGISRTVAAIVEQHHDGDGIVWPMPAAPYHVCIVPVNDRDAELRRVAELLYDQLQSLGVEVVLDDRSERAGVKFKDADLLGWPLRITVGAKTLAEGCIEVKERAGGGRRLVSLETAATDIAAAVRQGLGNLSPG